MQRSQRTIAKSVEVKGVGFLTGADVVLRFHPAAEHHGIKFLRADVKAEPIPALLEFTVPRERRTAIEKHGVVVELVEHVLAALAGMQVDNCLVELNAPEPPGLDGSCAEFVEAILAAGIVEQTATRPTIAVDTLLFSGDADGPQVIARPSKQPLLTVSYALDYGPGSPIPAQEFTGSITPERFQAEICFARTFILRSEVEALQAQGYGKRTTAKDLLVIDHSGVLDNELHKPDECARHKVLDCVGDFALIGCDVHGRFQAQRSGHRLNREIMRTLQKSQFIRKDSQSRHAA